MKERATDRKPHYAAFLSYSHKDAAMARRLHRRLEAYRLPAGVTRPGAKSAPSPSGSDRQLGRIFRDQDELPAAADLSEAVREGIARSDALIVLCSPTAAGSLWVDKEIRLFRELHPDRPILAAIVEGDPENAFPPALHDGGEPLAADLRPEGDGLRLGLLKLIAGLSGVGLDRLVQRDAQRRVRRVMGITAVSLIIMLGFFLLALVAWHAQREAERQRAEAEGLVEFMLTDLRQRLRSVGRLDVLAAANERAMNYYRDQGNLAHLPTDSLERRARILHAMGEDDIARGDLAAALHKFEEAHRTTAALLDSAPNNPERVFVHAQSEFWIGQADQLENRPEPALRYYQAYLASAQRLLSLQPRNPRSFAEVGYALSNIASVQWQSEKDFNEALKNYEMSLYWFKKAQAADPRSPTIRSEVAERHARLSDVLFDMHNFRAARVHRQRQLELLAPLRRQDPQNGDLAYDTLVATRALARIAFKSGDLPGAAAMLKDAEAQAAKLRARDPENQAWFEQQLRVLMDAVEVAREQHRRTEVVQLVEEAQRFLHQAGPGAANPAFRAASVQRLEAISHSNQQTGSNRRK